MSDVEEPPTKMSRYEDLQYLDQVDEEALEEEGQEEWLSEGALTDDDYMPPIKQEDESNDNSTEKTDETDKTKKSFEESNTIQTTTVIGQVELHDKSIINASITHGSIAHTNISHSNLIRANITQNIEEQLNNLESTQNGDELTDDLDAFLIRKTDGQVLEAKMKEVSDQMKGKQQDDGNNTDDLLRMLGEGDQKMKKKTYKVIKTEKIDDQGSSDDDDDYIYERSQVKTLKLAKNAQIKRTATKAIPENMSDGDDETDQSSDDGNTVQRMFEVKVPSSGKKSEQKRLVKHVVQVNTGNNRNQKSEQKVIRTYSGQKPGPKSSKQITNQKPTKSEIEVKTPAPFKPLEKSTSNEKKLKSDAKDTASQNDEFDELIEDEEFLDEEVTDLDEEEVDEDSEGDDSKGQRIMRPEVMDEEVPTDPDTNTDENIYDELPSSDSDDLEDWFTLDIRAERAGDYLPLLGTKARELLLAERSRVTSRVQTLHQSLSALTDSARRQAEQLKSASMALAEIDDTLRAL